MKFIKLLHNPEAGDGVHTKKELLSKIVSNGFECSYSSTKKKGWEKIEAEGFDLLAIAGGDGTVRRVADEVLHQKLIDKKLPIGLLPMGTANNIAKSLGIIDQPEDVIGTWNGSEIKKYDVGRIYGFDETDFFLEGIGYGVFPRLIKEMTLQNKESIADPDRRMKSALELLYDIILSYKARKCTVSVDGVDYSGSFLLAEVMNTCSIGPNLVLAPFADPGDGKLDVVLISEEQRDDFATYVENKIKGNEVPFNFNTIKAKNIELFWEGSLMHIDDKNIDIKKPRPIKIETLESVLEFLIPAKQS